MAMCVAHCRVAVQLERFLATALVRMISATASPSLFPKSGNVTLAKILQTLRFPGSAAFHWRVEDFLLRAAVYMMLHNYTYATLLCVCL